ncbi:hypothetical protein HPB50_018461 [Hyalomma asiaticum]|uniref:Uncharacterized protein n=1 Tax=Hyalomma asiaticum TaxID=266040 RepID=A0ACB7TKA7_HYAAI|nr:hypothetical protein HPB50_018461 [Hyalomma asiaticum]
MAIVSDKKGFFAVLTEGTFSEKGAAAVHKNSRQVTEKPMKLCSAISGTGHLIQAVQVVFALRNAGMRLCRVKTWLRAVSQEIHWVYIEAASGLMAIVSDKKGFFAVLTEGTFSEKGAAAVHKNFRQVTEKPMKGKPSFALASKLTGVVLTTEDVDSEKSWERLA